MASTLETKIDRIATAVTSALSALTAKGVTVPEGANVESLAALIESVEAGGGGAATPIAKWNDVTFIDYDGAVLHSYTLAEAQALTELPPLPEHDGLICQGWNWTLEDIKALNQYVTVGAMYITDDGATRLNIRIATAGRMTVPLYFGQSVANGVTIDWGDGSTVETLADTWNVSTSHTYAEPGNYIISLMPSDDCTLYFGERVLGYDDTYRNMLRAVFIGKNFSFIGNYTFQNCASLQSVTISGSVTSIRYAAFISCTALHSITIPGSVTSIGDSAFEGCTALVSITFQYGVASIGLHAMQSCISLGHITFPGSVTSIATNILTNCYYLGSIVFQDGVTSIDMYAFTGSGLVMSIKFPGSLASIGDGAFENWKKIRYYDFTACTSVPTLSNTSAFSSMPSDCQMLIPTALYDEWSAATNWATYASYMVAV